MNKFLTLAVVGGGLSALLIFFSMAVPLFSDGANEYLTRELVAPMARTVQPVHVGLRVAISLLLIAPFPVALRYMAKIYPERSDIRWPYFLSIVMMMLLFFIYFLTMILIQLHQAGIATLAGPEEPTLRLYLSVVLFNMFAPLLGDLQNTFAINLNPLEMVEQNVVTQSFAFGTRLLSVLVVLSAFLTVFRHRSKRETGQS